MKIVIAPDSIKGSMDAVQLCASIRESVLRVLPDADIIEVPLADGGEGSMHNLVYATKGTLHSVVAICGERLLSGHELAEMGVKVAF
jgi:glycerate kinase